jgi:hypothetical protein
MRRLGRIPGEWIAAFAAVSVVVAVVCVYGAHAFSPGALKAESRRSAVRGGVHCHAEIESCSACHAPPWSGEAMADRCLACHDDIRAQIDHHGPLHGSMPEADQCRTCHTEHQGAAARITRLDRFRHDFAAFPLTGKHTTLDCASCHIGQTYLGTPQSCAACHAEPAVHKGRFGSDCASCHSTFTWRDSQFKNGFDHDLASFKLTGKHTSVDCKSCHLNSVFVGTPQTCAACHAEPAVHKGRFGTACAHCHATITWKDTTSLIGSFDHDLAAFKLTGKHKSVDCKSCHVNNVFVGTSKSCVACHAEPVVHKGKYGTGCATCHSTTTFTGATFKHTFPINHGRRQQGNACNVCHNVPNTFAVYTCYSCHEHNPARIEKRHERVKLGGRKLEECASCHKNGRGGRERETALESCPRMGGLALGVRWDIDGLPSLPPRGVITFEKSANPIRPTRVAEDPVLARLGLARIGWEFERGSR